MNEISGQLKETLETDFESGLKSLIPDMISNAKATRAEVRQEQIYDAGAQKFGPLYAQLRKLLEQYDLNENDLFARTMMSWASLAGFEHPSRLGEFKKIGFNASHFSIKAALNTYLLPPDWNSYLEKINREQLLDLGEEISVQSKVNSHKHETIWGTFNRDVAIKDDYVHFFAPGDAVFDCIVDNAMHSCKGQASAFAFPAAINWTGFVFTCSLSPNISLLLEKGISVYALSPYRNYLMSEQIVVPVSIRNDDDLSDEIIIREFTKLIEAGFKPKNVVHLGKRGKKSGFLKDMISGESNIEWFRQNYTEENWKDLVNSSTKEASAKALEIIKHRSNIRGAREEMERVLSAKAANAEYYGLTNEGIEAIKQTQKAILDTIRRPRLILDSAAFVWMVKTNDEK